MIYTLYSCVHGVHWSEACGAGALEEKGGGPKFREGWFVRVETLNAVWDCLHILLILWCICLDYCRRGALPCRCSSFLYLLSLLLVVWVYFSVWVREFGPLKVQRKVEFVLYQSLDGVGFRKGRHQNWCMGVYRSRYIDQKCVCFLSWQHQLTMLCFSVSWRTRWIVLVELERWSSMMRVKCSEATIRKHCVPICLVSHWIIGVSSLWPHPSAQNCSPFGKGRKIWKSFHSSDFVEL